MLEKLIESDDKLLSLLEPCKFPPDIYQSNILFNSREYIYLTNDKKIVSYSDKTGNNESCISISFDIKGLTAISLNQCPYAGIDIKGKVTPNRLKAFLSNVTEELSKIGVKNILIKEPPFFLQDHQVENALAKCGFMISTEEINHHIELNPDDYYGLIHKMQRRKIEKCIQSGLSFCIEPRGSLDAIHEFIKTCRHQQGLIINISLDSFKQAFNVLPENYKMFSVRDQRNEIIACTVVVKLNQAVFYNYLPAFDRTFKNLSPLAFLTFKLCDYFKKEGFIYFDLGVSSIEGKPQRGLIDFKERMGGIISIRKSYLLTLQ